MKPDWIKMTDRRPTKEDVPVWLYLPKTNSMVFMAETGGTLIALQSNATHWRSAKDDIPEPPMEDDELQAARRWLDTWIAERGGNWSSEELMFSVLAWERGEVAGMLPDPKWDGKNPLGPMRYRDLCENAVSSIRARCKMKGTK